MTRVIWPLSMDKKDIEVFTWLLTLARDENNYLTWYYIEREHALVFEDDEDAVAFKLRFGL